MVTSQAYKALTPIVAAFCPLALGEMDLGRIPVGQRRFFEATMGIEPVGVI
jgi:hypothetical protein